MKNRKNVDGYMRGRRRRWRFFYFTFSTTILTLYDLGRRNNSRTRSSVHKKQRDQLVSSHKDIWIHMFK
jgi:hypothetical protein